MQGWCGQGTSLLPLPASRGCWVILAGIPPGLDSFFMLYLAIPTQGAREPGRMPEVPYATRANGETPHPALEIDQGAAQA